MEGRAVGGEQDWRLRGHEEADNRNEGGGLELSSGQGYGRMRNLGTGWIMRVRRGTLQDDTRSGGGASSEAGSVRDMLP